MLTEKEYDEMLSEYIKRQIEANNSHVKKFGDNDKFYEGANEALEDLAVAFMIEYK